MSWFQDMYKIVKIFFKLGRRQGTSITFEVFSYFQTLKRGLSHKIKLGNQKPQVSCIQLERVWNHLISKYEMISLARSIVQSNNGIFSSGNKITANLYSRCVSNIELSDKFKTKIISEKCGLKMWAVPSN